MEKTDDMSGAGDLRDNMATMSEMNLDDFASTEDVTVTFQQENSNDAGAPTINQSVEMMRMQLEMEKMKLES